MLIPKRGLNSPPSFFLLLGEKGIQSSCYRFAKLVVLCSGGAPPTTPGAGSWDLYDDGDLFRASASASVFGG